MVGYFLSSFYWNYFSFYMHFISGIQTLFLSRGGRRRFVSVHMLNRNRPQDRFVGNLWETLPPTETSTHPVMTPKCSSLHWFWHHRKEKSLQASSTNFLPKLPAAMTHSWGFHWTHLHKRAECYRGTARGKRTDKHKVLPEWNTKDNQSMIWLSSCARRNKTLFCFWTTLPMFPATDN